MDSTTAHETCRQCFRNITFDFSRIWINGNGPFCQECGASGIAVSTETKSHEPPPPPPKVSTRVTRCTTHSHACPCREYRMAKMEAALREIEQIVNSPFAVQCPSIAIGHVQEKCREALATGEGE